MKLKLVEFTEPCAKEIYEWKYEGEYSIYSYPEWNKVHNEIEAITTEKNRKTKRYK